MKNIIKVFCPILIGILCFPGCAYKEGIEQGEPQSYLGFTGSTQGAFASIDGEKPFTVDADQNGTANFREAGSSTSRTLYQISSGKHIIIVKKGGKIVVHREVLIGSGMTKEIRIP